MSLDALRTLRDKLASRDSATCGDARQWMVSELLAMIDRFLREHPTHASAEELRAFLIGGMRYVSDTAGPSSYGCEALGQALFEVFKIVGDSPQAGRP